MEGYRLIEYRPNRWIKIDPQGQVVGPATRQEVADWLSAQKLQDAEPAPEAGQPGQAPTPAPEQPEAHGVPQPPPPQPEPTEPDTTPEQGPCHPLLGRYRITSTFADHQNRTPPSTAPGLDFACPLGTEVRAWAAGRVIRSRWSDGGGRALWVEHVKGIRTYYAHLDSVSALEGETVAAGQKIGESGSTGHSTGPHLHFSLVYNGRYIDPAPYLPPEDGCPV